MGDDLPDLDDAERWHEHLVHTGRNFVTIEVEGFAESYTPEQARGIAAALEEAADEVDRND